MKKILFITSFIIASTIVNAQYYIGGSLSLGMSSNKIKDVDDTTNPSYSFSISPEIGYSLNDKTDIGLSLSASFSSSKYANIGEDIDGDLRAGGTGEKKTKGFEIAPYIRYSLLKWKKIDLIGMSSVYMSSQKTEYESIYHYEYEYEYGGGIQHSESKNKGKTKAWGARIHPVLQYRLSNKFTLLAHLNLFRLGFSQKRETMMYNRAGDEYTNITTGFDLGIDVKNALPSIGFIYKF